MDWFKNGNLIEEKTLTEVLQAYQNDMLKLPLYQRNMVWSEERICALWDSLLRGFPLPSFLLMEGRKGQSKDIEMQSNTTGQSVSDNCKEYFDLIDGQQRIAAIILGYMGNKSAIRLWIDLAPDENEHPFKFRYWIHACTKVFPFGFRMTASGEHDFSMLYDKEISDIWAKLQQSELKEKEFYELPLTETCPYKAGCPVPLDELVGLVNLQKQQLKASIIEFAEKYMKRTERFLEAQQKPKDAMVELVANGIIRLSQYKLAFQLINLDKTGEEDDYTLFERIGRGGVQITQRQLAVSQLMIELGKEGNDAVAEFQRSETLQHLLETEDIIHGLARVAYAATSSLNTAENTEETKNERDLIEITPARIKSIRNDKRWTAFIEKLNGYCKPVNSENSKSLLQQAFENLFRDIRYNKNNPNGFSLAQLAQPDRDREGISPITLHPLLYLYLEKDFKSERDHIEEMERWILFANGFVSEPSHARLNREVFAQVRRSNKIDFSEIKRFVFSEEQLRKELGFSWDKPVYEKENKEIVQKGREHDDIIPTPEEVTELSLRRLILGNWWSYSRVNWFILLWNQRESMEHLYGKIEYIPALFSKGRPFDKDHIVARNRFSLRSFGVKGISENLKNGVALVISRSIDFKPISQLSNDADSIKLSEDNFRKGFPNHPANYRYWPKRLNRSDSDAGVGEKMNLERVKQTMKDHPLTKKFFDINDDTKLWDWSAIPNEDIESWRQLPPTDDAWDENIISNFILSTFKREYFLYGNAYRFIAGL